MFPFILYRRNTVQTDRTKDTKSIQIMGALFDIKKREGENQMKELKLNDESIVNLSDISTKTDMVTVVKSWGDIDKMNLTKENIEGATMGDEELDTIFLNVAAVRGKEDGNVEVHINMREKTLEERFTESQAEQDAMIGMILDM